MHSDPILREVHRMKDQLARRVGGDVGKLFDLLREAARKHPERMVKSPSRTGAQGRRRRITGKK